MIKYKMKQISLLVEKLRFDLYPDLIDVCSLESAILNISAKVLYLKL